jgi:hypothetical protein
MKSINRIVGNNFKFHDHQTVIGIRKEAFEVKTFSEIIELKFCAELADEGILTENKMKLLSAFDYFFKNEYFLESN